MLTRVHVNDIDLVYGAQGRGDAVVFVHGSAFDYRSWTNQIEPFSEQFRVVAYSRPFTGLIPSRTTGLTTLPGSTRLI